MRSTVINVPNGTTQIAINIDTVKAFANELATVKGVDNLQEELAEIKRAKQRARQGRLSDNNKVQKAQMNVWMQSMAQVIHGTQENTAEVLSDHT